MPVILKPVGEIKANLGIEVNGPVQKEFTETCYRYMDKYVPMDKGNLRTIVDIENNYIIYESRYAHYQYVNQFENYTTEGTGPYWDKKMVSAEINDVIDEVRDYMKYHGGK